MKLEHLFPIYAPSLKFFNICTSFKESYIHAVAAHTFKLMKISVYVCIQYNSCYSCVGAHITCKTMKYLDVIR